MATLTVLTNRLLAAGSLAVAAAAAPLMISLAAPAPHALADDTCPDTEVFDPDSWACQPISDVTPPTENPLNPETAVLAPDAITQGDGSGAVGQLGSVDGVPCTGDNTGKCIGLELSQGPQDNVVLPPVPVGVTP
jgi:hypothetical protein